MSILRPIFEQEFQVGSRMLTGVFLVVANEYCQVDKILGAKYRKDNKSLT